MNKTKQSHPFQVKALLPKGHIAVLKSKSAIRKYVYETFEQAETEMNSLINTGACVVLIKDISKKGEPILTRKETTE